jgi:Polyketide cyclase / dehydrase and lipid transport
MFCFLVERITMKTYQASGTALINAPAAQVYALIADYGNGHPHILPPAYFQNLTVEKGGVGAGTVIRFEMRVFGQTQTFRAAISEPEPGRVLVESDLAGGPVTTFTVDSQGNGQQAQVTITTVSKTRSGGIGGWIEGLMAPLFLRRVYAQELKLLATLAEERTNVGMHS